MLRLVFMICMLDAPGDCETRELLIHDDVPLMACVTGAMPELAVWRETHLNWRIARWHCEDDRKDNRMAGRNRGDTVAADRRRPAEPQILPASK